MANDDFQPEKGLAMLIIIIIVEQLEGHIAIVHCPNSRFLQLVKYFLVMICSLSKNLQTDNGIVNQSQNKKKKRSYCTSFAIFPAVPLPKLIKAGLAAKE